MHGRKPSPEALPSQDKGYAASCVLKSKPSTNEYSGGSAENTVNSSKSFNYKQPRLKLNTEPANAGFTEYSQRRWQDSNDDSKNTADR